MLLWLSWSTLIPLKLADDWNQITSQVTNEMWRRECGRHVTFRHDVWRDVASRCSGRRVSQHSSLQVSEIDWSRTFHFEFLLTDFSWLVFSSSSPLPFQIIVVFVELACHYPALDIFKPKVGVTTLWNAQFILKTHGNVFWCSRLESSFQFVLI